MSIVVGYEGTHGSQSWFSVEVVAQGSYSTWLLKWLFEVVTRGGQLRSLLVVVTWCVISNLRYSFEI